MTIWTKSFALSLLERVIATFLMAFLAITGLDAGGAIGADGLDNVNWINALVGAAIAAGLSLIKGVVANLITKDGPSLSHSEQVVPPLPAPPAS
jgi:uncharacterized transporter YbjL